MNTTRPPAKPASVRPLRRAVLGTCASLTVAAMLSPAVLSAQTVELRFADRLPVDHYIARYATNYWIDEVQKATKDAVKITRYPSQRLGKSKDMLTLTRSGVVDMGEYVPGYLGDQMPLSGIAEVPGIVPSACAASNAYEALANPDGFLGKAELAPLGLRLLYVVGLPAYQLFTSKKMDTLASFEGLKIRSTGAAMDAGLRQLGIVPIRMSAAELNESFSRGTVDGTAFPAASMFSYDLQDKTKFATTDLSFGSTITFYAISTKVWDQLPADVQKAMVEIGAKTTQRACELIDKDNEAALKKLEAGGTQLVTLSPEDRKKFDAKLDPVATEWAQAMDNRGKPGTEILKLFRAAMANR